MERSASSSFGGTTTFNLPGDTRSFADTGLQSGTTYYYRVKAISATTASAYSNTASATTYSSSPIVPAAPTNLSLSVSGNSKRPKVALSWTDNATNESAYVVERSLNQSTWTTQATLSANAVRYTDTQVSSATRYYYRVKATNLAGSSAYSAVASVVTR